jgi:hypothetical protein
MSPNSRRRWPWLLLVLAPLVALALWLNSSTRWTLRWWFSSGSYKSSTLTQLESEKHELRHVEWDAWGWGGEDTEVYLVFDPTDALASAAKDGKPGKFTGIPCEAFRVRRMQSQWYLVEYYTATTWAQCHS